MDARKTVPTVAVLFLFLFLFFNILFIYYFFAMFYVDMGRFLLFLHFFVFFMFTVFGIPDIERRKKEESSYRPATRIFVRK